MIMQQEQGCEHLFKHQAGMEIDGLIYDIFYCQKCLTNVKKEKLCPKNIESVKG